jgi:hypothetical protein
MATAVRNTGTRFRFDGDDQKWHARVRLTETSTDGERFLEFITQVATLVELLAWIADIMDGVALDPDRTMQGHSATGPTVITGG